jgi:ArsR family transcriptional regulator
MRVANAQIVDAMAPRPAFALEVASGTAFELLIALFAASPATCPDATREALEAVGDRSGELWLHLLGLALELDSHDSEALIERVARLRPLELRRHLLGLYVPSWYDLVGAETIERAARGNPSACKTLLAHPRYYAGRAEDALGVILPLGAAETKRRVLEALQRFRADVFAPDAVRIEADAAEKRRLAAVLDPYEVIDQAAGGYRYEAEEEFGRVVLVPHVAAAPRILLCQHRDARLICYAADDREHAPGEVLLTLGRALSDPKRIAILNHLRSGDASLAELSGALGLARSTTHYHLGQLRAARLIVLRGNAAGYRYTLDPAGFEAAERALRR